MHNWFKINQNEKGGLVQNCISLICSALLILSFFILCGVSPATAVTVSTGDYLLQFQTEPAPPIAGEETLITLKALNSLDGTPARHGRILINLTETEDTEEINRSFSHDLSAFRLLKEQDDFGNYGFAAIFPRHAPYHVDIAVMGSNGTPLSLLEQIILLLQHLKDLQGLR